MRSTDRTRWVVVAATAAIASVVSACSTQSATTPPVAPAGLWALRADPEVGARDAGLQLASMAGMGAMAAHFHVHVAVLINGTRAAVPAGIGIAPSSGDMTDLHTHDPSGLVHVEAMGKRTYTLGQLFAEWGQRLDANHVGTLTADATHPLTLVVNGTTVPGNPASLLLADHQEIALVYGATAPGPVPTASGF